MEPILQQIQGLAAALAGDPAGMAGVGLVALGLTGLLATALVGLRRSRRPATPRRVRVDVVDAPPALSPAQRVRLERELARAERAVATLEERVATGGRAARGAQA